jgi:uncharacterized oxidoreductase
MPLADYISEVMQILGQPDPPNDEVLVEPVKALRWAERGGGYERMYAALNGG